MMGQCLMVVVVLKSRMGLMRIMLMDSLWLVLELVMIVVIVRTVITG